MDIEFDFLNLKFIFIFFFLIFIIFIFYHFILIFSDRIFLNIYYDKNIFHSNFLFIYLALLLIYLYRSYSNCCHIYFLFSNPSQNSSIINAAYSKSAKFYFIILNIFSLRLPHSRNIWTANFIWAWICSKKIIWNYSQSHRKRNLINQPKLFYLPTAFTAT